MNIGQSVFFKQQPDKPWSPGRIISQTSDRPYLVKSKEGGEYVRNRQFIKPYNDESTRNSMSPPSSTGSPKELQVSPNESVILISDEEPEEANKSARSKRTVRVPYRLAKDYNLDRSASDI